MNSFRRYDHVEKYGYTEVENIDIGKVYVFPKLDGTNSSIWFSGGNIGTGSRNRELTLKKDNAGFRSWVNEKENTNKFLRLKTIGFLNCNIYGEWMVPHTLKTYRPDIWKRFWIFDVFDREKNYYLPYEEYAVKFVETGLDVIEPLCTINNPTEEQLQHQVNLNTYLIQDGAGAGEGIVIKNYEWQSLHGRQCWAKIVRNEFKEKSHRKFGCAKKNGKFSIEQVIAEEYVTPELVAKVRAKIVNDSMPKGLTDYSIGSYLKIAKTYEEQNRSKVIPRLLQTVYTDIVQEEIYQIIKKYKDPTINFKKLRAHCILMIKKFATDLF